MRVCWTPCLWPKMLLSIFLVLSAVPLVSMPPLLTCHIGQRVHTSANNINICEDCLSGTFMNLSSHSLTQCFICSECPAGRFIGRECNLTSNTVCCPMADMTVIDMEAGPYCAISADEYLANYTATCDNNTGQISNNGGVQNRSETVGVYIAVTYYVRCLGYIFAIAVIAYLILFHKSRHIQTKLECVLAISMIFIKAVFCAMFFVFEDSTNSWLFMTYMILFVISYTFGRKLRSCLNSILKPRNVATIPRMRQNAPGRSQDYNYVPENQQSDPFINSDAASNTSISLTDEPVPGGIADNTSSNLTDERARGTIAGNTSSNLTDERARGTIADNTSSNSTDEPEPGDIADNTSISLTDEPARGTIAGNTSSNLTDEPARGTIAGNTSSNMNDEPEPGGTADNNEYTPISAEVGDDPNDTSLHTEASGCRPASHSVVAPELILQTSGSGDCCSDKAGENGRSRGAGVDDDGNTELSHDALGLNFRTESKSKEIEASNKTYSG